jgi:tripartite-type tricarboxylate transporter receptor subunit TctC
MGLDPAELSNERFAARIRTEQQRWTPVLRESGLTWKEGRDG